MLHFYNSSSISQKIMLQTNSTQFRKKIISFAWTWVGLLIFIGIMSLFSIWSINRAYVDEAKMAFTISQLENEVLSAKVDFKTEVQEWKNILLRGKNREDRTKYFLSFENEETKVVGHLKEAQKICLALDKKELDKKELCQPIEKALFEHQELGRIYKETLNKGSLESYEGIHAIDQNLRGIDRSLDNHIETLFQNFSHMAKDQLNTSKQSIENRYYVLKKFILGIMLAALSLSGISLYSILRSTKN
jgi:methyl-accepting chemotaxis protein